MMRVALLAAVLLTGCLQAVDDFSSNRSLQPETGNPSAQLGDAGAPPDAGGLAVAYDCLTFSGVSKPDIFGGMSGWAVVGTCPGSACSDFTDMDTACAYGLQVNNARSTVVLSPSDCDALRRWFTSDVLLHGLGSSCGDGSGDESLVVQLTGGPIDAKKFSGCTEEPFPSHRACLKAIRTKYFPDK
jgi:hypothetical protein